MIDLHERLSEFSYGYGVTREVESLLRQRGLSVAPFLPSLPHEEQLGFDVGFSDLGVVVVLQFKLGQELRRFHRTSPSHPIPQLDHPFWRFGVDTKGHQFRRLREFEAAGAEAYYAAPKFSDWKAYERAFQRKEVLERSLLVEPSRIEGAIKAQRGKPGPHRLVYDKSRHYVCSDPAVIEVRSPIEVADRIFLSVYEAGLSLEQRLKMLFDRERLSGGPGRLSVASQAGIYERIPDGPRALAEILGLEAWSVGAQMLFVTDKG